MKIKNINTDNIHFPLEKQINLKSYLDFELKSEPNNINKFKCFDALIKRLKNKKDYKEKILKNIIESNKQGYYIDKLKINNNSPANFSSDKKKEKIYSPNNRNINQISQKQVIKSGIFEFL